MSAPADAATEAPQPAPAVKRPRFEPLPPDVLERLAPLDFAPLSAADLRRRHQLPTREEWLAQTLRGLRAHFRARLTVPGRRPHGDCEDFDYYAEAFQPPPHLPKESPFTVWQELLPHLRRAFPGVQFTMMPHDGVSRTAYQIRLDYSERAERRDAQDPGAQTYSL